MTVTAAIGYLKQYVKQALEGMGILKGSPAKIKSITDVPSPLEPTVPISHEITFEWDSQPDPSSLTPVWVETKMMVVDNGRQIYNIVEIPEKRTGTELYYEVTYYDNSKGHFYIPMSSSQMKRKVVTVLPTPETADLNTIYMIED